MKKVVAATNYNLGLFSVANHKGKAIIVTGGCIESSTTRSVLRFDIATQQFSELCPMNEPRSYHSSAIANNTLAVFAGHCGTILLSTIEMINLTTGGGW